MGKASLLLVTTVATILATGCSSAEKKASTTEPAAAATTIAKETVVKAAAGAIACESKTDKRTLEVRGKSDGCELAYTKSGKETIVATSSNGTAHCAKVQSRIQDNLKKSGFACQ